MHNYMDIHMQKRLLKAKRILLNVNCGWEGNIPNYYRI